MSDGLEIMFSAHSNKLQQMDHSIYFFLSHADYNLKEKKKSESCASAGVLVIKGLSIGLSDACMLGFKKKS